MDWIEVKVHTTTAGADLVSEQLMQEGATGTMVEDRADVPDPTKPNGFWEMIDPDLIEKMPEDVVVHAWFEPDHRYNDRMSALRDRLIDGLSKIPHSALNGDPVNRLPGNVSFCFEGIEGESLLLLLDAKGICASSGSACTSGSLDPSHVLLAIGRPHEVAHGSLRLSLCEWNTQEEVDYMLQVIPEVVAYLRSMSPVWKELLSGQRQFML